MKFNVTLHLVVEAETSADAVDIGFSACEHLCDTFNDNDSISPLVSVEANAVVTESQP